LNNNKWMSGREVMKRWNALEFEILKAFKNGLPAYKRKTGEILNYDRIKDSMTGWYFTVTDRDLPIATESDLTEILLDQEKIVFSLAGVEEYEKKHGLKIFIKEDTHEKPQYQPESKLASKSIVQQKPEIQKPKTRREEVAETLHGLSTDERKRKQELMAYHMKTDENQSWTYIADILFGDRVKSGRIKKSSAVKQAQRYARNAGYKPAS